MRKITYVIRASIVLAVWFSECGGLKSQANTSLFLREALRYAAERIEKRNVCPANHAH